MTVGILMEKSSAAKNGAAAWGGMSGTFNGERYVIGHARGHLFEHVSPDQMVTTDLADRYKKWDLENLPWDPSEMNWSLQPTKDSGSVRSDLKAKLADCEEIAIATDDDPSGEGDAIAIRAILELGLTGRKYTRMYFTDESAKSLGKAFTERKPVPSLTEHPAFKMAAFRDSWDMLSMQWTRVATNMSRASGTDAMLRQGRLKSAMVKLVGDQLKAHNDYVKKPFFQNRFRDENSVVYTNPEEPTFDTPDQVPQQYSASDVVVDSKSDKTTAPPKLLDLAGLSTLLAKSGLKPELMLKIYQSGYERQYFSYPRTEDRTITPEQFNELNPLVDKIAGVVGIDTGLLTHRGPRKTHVKAKGAHGANRPGPKVPASMAALDSELGKGAGAIYEALAKNYLAMLADDYRYEQQKGHVKDYADFKGVANVPQSAGWKAVFNAAAALGDDEDADESNAGLGTRADPFVHEGANKRPEHPSMSWLMKQLERRDVGTGATRTSTYSDVTSTTAKYPLLVDSRSKLTLAEAGQMSWLLLPDTHIGDLALTEKVYADMSSIAEGTVSAEERLAVVADWVRHDIEVMQRNAVTMRSTLGLSERKLSPRTEGVWQTAPGGPKRVAFKQVWADHEFTDDEVARLLTGETIEFDFISKSGNAQRAKGALGLGEFKGRKFVGFQLEIPDRPTSWCKRDFTDAEVDQLLAGETLELNGFTSKKGRQFGAKVSWDAKTKRIEPHFEDKKTGGTKGGTKSRSKARS